jgi:formate dehydrogenase (hydrogenase)
MNTTRRSRRTAPAPLLRLTEPLVRENGALRPATWDEALDRAAEGFRRNIEARGPDSVGTFSCSKSTNEVNYLAQKLSRAVFGTNNIDSCNRT